MSLCFFLRNVETSDMTYVLKSNDWIWTGGRRDGDVAICWLGLQKISTLKVGKYTNVFTDYFL